jgi:hypothetical protein
MRKRLLALLVITPLLFSSQLSTSHAATKAGAKCSKVGSKSVVGAKTFTCIKSGKKLVWDKGVKVTATTKQSIQLLSYANMKKAMLPKPVKDLFRYHYSPNAVKGYKEKIESELNYSMEYWTSVYDGTELFNVFYGTEKDLEWLISAWKTYDLDKNGYTANEYKGRLEREGNQLNAGSVPSQEGPSHLSFFRSSTRPIQDDAMIPHENVHIVQQQLTKSRTDQMPCWLREGTANLFGGFQTAEKYGLRVYDEAKRSEMNAYQGGSVEIRKFTDSEWFTHLKSLEGNFSGGCDYKNRFAYGAGLLLSEVLMADSGFEKMMEFWRAFSLEVDWRQSFKNIYGVEIDTWYKTKGIPHVMSAYARVPGYK